MVVFHSAAFGTFALFATALCMILVSIDMFGVALLPRKKLIANSEAEIADDRRGCGSSAGPSTRHGGAPKRRCEHRSISSHDVPLRVARRERAVGARSVRRVHRHAPRPCRCAHSGTSAVAHCCVASWTILSLHSIRSSSARSSRARVSEHGARVLARTWWSSRPVTASFPARASLTGRRVQRKGFISSARHRQEAARHRVPGARR